MYGDSRRIETANEGISRFFEPIYCRNCEGLKGFRFFRKYSLIYHRPCRIREYYMERVKYFIAPIGFISAFMQSGANRPIVMSKEFLGPTLRIAPARPCTPVCPDRLPLLALGFRQFLRSSQWSLDALFTYSVTFRLFCQWVLVSSRSAYTPGSDSCPWGNVLRRLCFPLGNNRRTSTSVSSFCV